MKNELLEHGSEVRSALVDNILRYIDNKRCRSALSISGRYQRLDAIGSVLRDAVILSPIVMFSGDPHTYVHSCGYYKRFKWNDLEDSLYVVMRRVGVKDGDYSRVTYYCKICISAISSREYSIDTSVVVMKNGVYNTFTHKLCEFSEKFLTNAYVDYEYNESDNPVLWKRFLDQVLPSREYQNLLQEFIASCYVVRSIVKMEHMLILLGNGQNGKSVVFEIVSALLGDDNVTHFYLSELIGGQRREQNVASCKGKRLNYCSEIRTKEIDVVNSDAIKTLISSEPVMGRKLYCEPEKIDNFPLLMANANELPKIKDPSESLMRRFLVIPFEVTIPKEKQNLELSTNIKTELSGIFNWAMEGLKRLRKNGYKLSVPDGVSALVTSYFTENSSIARWTTENMILSRPNGSTGTTSEWLTVSIMYSSYCRWCIEEGEEHVSRKQFSQDMRSRGFAYIRGSSGFGFVFYKGVTLEQVKIQNMQMAIDLERTRGKKDLKTKHTADGVTKVIGVSDAEKYLGLPEDTIMPYMKIGKLEGSYTHSVNGPVFDVAKLQIMLSEAGYFSDLKDVGEDKMKQIGFNMMRGFRHKFNNEMRTRGLPFRKYSGEIHIQDKLVDFVLVPDEWVYTTKNAELKLQEQKQKKAIRNGRSNQE